MLRTLLFPIGFLFCVSVRVAAAVNCDVNSSVAGYCLTCPSGYYGQTCNTTAVPYPITLLDWRQYGVCCGVAALVLWSWVIVLWSWTTRDDSVLQMLAEEDEHRQARLREAERHVSQVDEVNDPAENGRHPEALDVVSANERTVALLPPAEAAPAPPVVLPPADVVKPQAGAAPEAPPVVLPPTDVAEVAPLVPPAAIDRTPDRELPVTTVSEPPPMSTPVEVPLTLPLSAEVAPGAVSQISEAAPQSDAIGAPAETREEKSAVDVAAASAPNEPIERNAATPLPTKVPTRRPSTKPRSLSVVTEEPNPVTSPSRNIEAVATKGPLKEAVIGTDGNFRVAQWNENDARQWTDSRRRRCSSTGSPEELLTSVGDRPRPIPQLQSHVDLYDDADARRSMSTVRREAPGGGALHRGSRSLISSATPQTAETVAAGPMGFESRSRMALLNEQPRSNSPFDVPVGIRDRSATRSSSAAAAQQRHVSHSYPEDEALPPLFESGDLLVRTHRFPHFDLNPGGKVGVIPPGDVVAVSLVEVVCNAEGRYAFQYHFVGGDRGIDQRIVELHMTRAGRDTVKIVETDDPSATPRSIVRISPRR